ncbi:MAG TPA: NAD(P)-dependent alcohol dehydrogenase [Thermoanaerobaculia bacterium]|jgi:NADPH:quinone reductase-like Zn-dependent oxidoreductase|nr:NAD(P)-dependent alcohol dehydrogenase [Thermoanaerobaculia bacterium]
MKAAVIDGYGGSEHLTVRELPEPGPPGSGQVLLRVQAAGVNPLDWKIRRGRMRLIMPARFPLILGFDVAGEVLAIGPEVTRFQPGDAVFGVADVNPQGGSYAELTLAREAALAALPGSLSFEEAAALPMAGLTALQGLRDKGELVAGERVAINGAAGGVGHFAVQVAAALGAHVTAVASGRNLEFVRSLGAHEAIDYEEEEFTARDETWDVIFDLVGNRSFADCEEVLSRNGGIYISTVPSARLFLSVAAATLGGLLGQRKRGRFVKVQYRGEDLTLLARLAEQGELRPVIQEVFPLEEARKAHEISEAGHVSGKLAVRVG